MARRFQFSIRFLLMATTAVATGVAAYRVTPSLLAFPTLNGLAILYATAAIVGTVQTTGMVRTFWIGTSVMLGIAAAISSLSTWQMMWEVSFPGIQTNYTGPRNYLCAIWCASPINGLFAVLCQWMFSQRKDAA